jgi:hypothetical protein
MSDKNKDDRRILCAKCNKELKIGEPVMRIEYGTVFKEETMEVNHFEIYHKKCVPLKVK